MTETLPAVLLQNRQITGAGCWEWTKGRDPYGYGRLRWNGDIVRAHRLVAHLVHGLDLSDRRQVARHRCDNPPCFNPEHIEPGTTSQNVRDQLARGQYRRVRLSRDDVAAIRAAHAAGESASVLDERYGLSSGYAQRVIRAVDRWAA